MNDNNLNFGTNYGNIGGYGNTVNIQVEPSMFVNTGTKKSKVGRGEHNILLIEMLEYAGELAREIERGTIDNRYPIKINITQLVDTLAQGVYQNEGNTEDEVWQMVHSLFSVACALVGLDFYMRWVKVGSQYYYELYQCIE